MQPVILGGDIGAYSLARAFHEAFGVRSVVVSAVSTGITRNSRILTHLNEPEIDDPEVVVVRLQAIAKQFDGEDLIAVASADWLVRVLAANKERLSQYVIPYVGVELFDSLTDKQGFAALCSELGIPHPRTLVHNFAGDFTADAEPDISTLTFPVIAKAASSTEMHHCEYPGKMKVHTVASAEDLADLLARVRESGFTGKFLIQDFIPGDDSGMRILTCYSDRFGKVRFASFGQVLLEEHAPGALGNPAGIVTSINDDVVAQATRLLEHVGWTGFANFDLKFDPRTGETVFFELNPRLGRSQFYLTAAGTNPTRLYAAEHLSGDDPDPRQVFGPVVNERGAAVKVGLYSVLPIPLLLRYLFDGPLRARIRRLWLTGKVTNPLWYRVEWHPRRLAYIATAQLNQYIKFRRHYPVAIARRRWEAGR